MIKSLSLLLNSTQVGPPPMTTQCKSVPFSHLIWLYNELNNIRDPPIAERVASDKTRNKTSQSLELEYSSEKATNLDFRTA